MTAFRKVTDDFAVSPQITPADVEAAAADGVTLVINNRPDGEDSGQPPGAVIATAAKQAGVDYVHIPIVGRPTPAQVQAMKAAMSGASGKVLAYCRAGTRSITTWAMGADQPRETVLGLGRAAGYDLSGMLP
jgi:uncharacterized protein (TIGR01244 family)